MTDNDIDATLSYLREQLRNPHCRVTVASSRPVEELPFGVDLVRHFRPGPQTITTITLVTDHEQTPIYKSLRSEIA